MRCFHTYVRSWHYLTLHYIGGDHPTSGPWCIPMACLRTKPSVAKWREQRFWKFVFFAWDEILHFPEALLLWFWEGSITYVSSSLLRSLDWCVKVHNACRLPCLASSQLEICWMNGMMVKPAALIILRAISEAGTPWFPCLTDPIWMTGFVLFCFDWKFSI